MVVPVNAEKDKTEDVGAENRGQRRGGPPNRAPRGVFNSSTMIVIRMAMTPSLNASSRVVFIGCIRAILRERETIAAVNLARMLRPLPRRVARAASLLVLLAWIVTMGVVLTRDLRAGAVAEPRDRSGALRHRRGVARRLLPRREGRLHGQPDDADRRRVRGPGRRAPADVAARRHDRGGDPDDGAARSRRSSCARSSSRSIPAPARSKCRASSAGKHVSLTIKTASGTQHEERDLDDVPVLSLSLPRRLAAQGFKPGTRAAVPALRSGDDAQRAGDDRRSARREIVNITSPMPARVGPRDTYRVDAPVDAGVPRRHGVRRPEDDRRG